MLNEMTLYGYIEVPYPYLENFRRVILENKSSDGPKDFPDFINNITECRPSAVCPFAYILSYEEGDEQLYVERFTMFLNKIKFTRAYLHFVISENKAQFFQFYSDDEKVYKYENKVVFSEDPLHD